MMESRKMREARSSDVSRRAGSGFDTHDRQKENGF